MYPQVLVLLICFFSASTNEAREQRVQPIPMAAEDVAIIERAVQETLALFQKNAPKEFAMLKADPQKMKTLTETARAAAAEQVELSNEFVDQPNDIAQRLAKHLPESRINLVRGALAIETFHMYIAKKSDEKYWAEMTRGGRLLAPGPILLNDRKRIDWAMVQQYGSICVEAVMLAMSAAGIEISPSGRVIDRAVSETVVAIRASSSLRRALQAFIARWNNAGGNAYHKAKALFDLLREAYDSGILWQTIKTICSEMSWWDWTLTSAKVLATLIAALFTEGAALIANIALTAIDAFHFAAKIANINKLVALRAII